MESEERERIEICFPCWLYLQEFWDLLKFHAGAQFLLHVSVFAFFSKYLFTSNTNLDLDYYANSRSFKQFGQSNTISHLTCKERLDLMPGETSAVFKQFAINLLPKFMRDRSPQLHELSIKTQHRFILLSLRYHFNRCNSMSIYFLFCNNSLIETALFFSPRPSVEYFVMYTWHSSNQFEVYFGHLTNWLNCRVRSRIPVCKQLLSELQSGFAILFHCTPTGVQ